MFSFLKNNHAKIIKLILKITIFLILFDLSLTWVGKLFTSARKIDAAISAANTTTNYDEAIVILKKAIKENKLAFNRYKAIKAKEQLERAAEDTEALGLAIALAERSTSLENRIVELEEAIKRYPKARNKNEALEKLAKFEKIASDTRELLAVWEKVQGEKNFEKINAVMQEAFRKFPLATNKKIIEQHLETLRRISNDTEAMEKALNAATEASSLEEAISILQDALTKYTNAYNYVEAQQQLDFYNQQAAEKKEEEDRARKDPLEQIIEEAKASTDLEVAIKILEKGLLDYGTSECRPRAEALLVAYKEKLSNMLKEQNKAMSNFIEGVRSIKDSSYTFYPVESAPKIPLVPVTLYDSPLINRTALFKYILDVKMNVVSEKEETTTSSSMKLKITQVRNKPRLIFGLRDGDMPAGGRLIVEYFVVNPEEKKGYEYHSSEVVNLPAISKGKLLAVDINGISYEKVEGRTSQPKKLRDQEKPLLGFIVSFYSPDNLLLTQRYSSPKLAEECSHKFERR